MNTCPACGKPAISKIYKVLTGPLLHFHCPECQASLSTSWTIVWLFAGYGLAQVVALAFGSVIVRICVALAGGLLCSMYWIWFAPLIERKG